MSDDIHADVEVVRAEPLLRTVLLPTAGLLYTLMTVDSGRRYWMRRGGGWKGRTY